MKIIKHHPLILRDCLHSAFCILHYAFIVLLFCALASAASPTMDASSSRALLEKADGARGNIAGLEWTVRVAVRGEQEENTRVIKVQVKNNNCLATFLAPSVVQGQMLLMKQNNMWFIKPGLSKPVNISPRQRLLGGASNADIAATNYAGDYDPVFVGTDAVRGVACYVLMLKARNTTVTYDGIKYWISMDKNLGLKAEFYSVSGKILKTAYFTYDATIELDGKKRAFVSEMDIEDTMVQRTTTLTYTDISKKTFSDSTFNLATLTQ